MKLVELSELKRDLDFHPSKDWPENLPPFAWKGQLLSGFHLKSGQAIENSEASLFSLFYHCHPDLALSELARAFEALCRTFPQDIQEADFLQFYNLVPSPRLMRLFETLRSLPPYFQSWIDEKKMKSRDLSILESFHDFSLLEPVFSEIVDLKASKSEGTQILELAGELILMDKGEEVFADTAQRSPKAWIKQLERKRFPLSSRKTAAAENLVATWPWPAKINGEWIRRGDESGLEVKFIANSPEDYQKKLQGLKKLETRIIEENPWQLD